VDYEPFSFPGTYADAFGEEEIVWLVEPSRRVSAPGYELRTVIRGVPCLGHDFDGIELVDSEHVDRTQLPFFDEWGNLAECVLIGELPCAIEIDERVESTVVRFSLDLHKSALKTTAAPRNLTLTVEVDGTGVEVADDWFEGGMLRLDALMPGSSRLRCCVTCLYSDYSPGGHGLMGMSCHRDVKEQYLAVRSKSDYWPVPVTEVVMETYVCREYERRVPGTGYRG
jgi:Family of unknown function (DUF6304)